VSGIFCHGGTWKKIMKIGSFPSSSFSSFLIEMKELFKKLQMVSFLQGCSFWSAPQWLWLAIQQ